MSDIKIIVTTSNKYLHILPIFFFLFNKYWRDKEGNIVPCEVVGYDKPQFSLPDNFTFHSLGKQVGDAKNFTRDLRKYFALQPSYVIWLMEDTFLKAPVKCEELDYLSHVIYQDGNIGRANLTGECLRQDHEVYFKVTNFTIYKNAAYSKYRLSTQPSIWSISYLLRHMVNDLTPWEFESQADYSPERSLIIGLDHNNCPVLHNEGVRKHDLYQFDLNGIDIDELKENGLI